MDAGQSVSRETKDRLRVFEALVLKWTPKINLISREDRHVIWDRHILDSLQIYRAAPTGFSHWLDFGSGGGFPGVVVAILAGAENPAAKVTLVESDARKATFLRTALRETGAPGAVITDRIERLEPCNADVISARAVTDLPGLLQYSAPHLAKGGTCLFPKGAKWRTELAEAKSLWKFDCTAVTSMLDLDAAILSIRELSRA